MADNVKMDDDVITLVYDDGEEETFSVLDVVELDGKTYAVLLPESRTDEAKDAEDEDAEDYVEERIFRVEKDDNGDDVLVDLDDDEYERVADALDEMWEKECELLEEEDENEDEDEDEE